MTYWARLSVGWYRDPKVAPLSVQAELLYVRGIAYTVDELTDGFVSRQALPIIAAKLDEPEQLAAELCAAKLWLRRRYGWTYPPAVWSKWQETKDKVAARRQDAAERQRRARAARVTRDSHVTEQPVTRDSHVSHSAVTRLDKTLEREREPTLSSTEKVKEAHARQSSEPVLLSDQLDAALSPNSEANNGRHPD